MNKFKICLSILLCFTLLFAFSLVSVSAVTTIEYGDYTLAINGDDTYSVYKYNGSSAFAAIPNEANGMPVVSISSYCFENTNAKYVLLSKNITAIKDYAFYGANNLISVAIPATVTSIGSYAFADCPLLGVVDFADDIAIETFSAGLFSGCTSMKSVEIPASVTTIKSNFASGSAVEEVVIPDNVTSLGDSAFADCASLTSVTLSDSIAELEGYSFSGCTSLSSVTIPEGVTSIGNRCFYGCTALADVDIPTSCTSIGVKAFYNCLALNTVFVPRKVNSIGADCFYPMNIKQTIVINGFTDTYAQEYSYANGADFADFDSKIGDANYDDDVDINDVTTVQKHLAKLSLIDTSEKMSFADSSKDGSLSIRDATYIQMYIAKYIDNF